MKIRLILCNFGWRFSMSECLSLVRAAYSFTRSATLLILFVTAVSATTTTAIAQAPPGSLWYNGDPDNVNGLANERNTLVTQAAVYDDFNVSSPLGWHVTTVLSHDLFSPDMSVTAADWEIRIGLSEGNAGTLVAGGTTNSPVVTNYHGTQNEFIVEVTQLNVFLPMLPSGQHYWLNVTPVGEGTGRSFNSTTSGTNCVGTPCGNDSNAFWNSSYFGAVFTSTSGQCTGCNDFSMGIIGTVVPEPATLALFACGLGGLLVVFGGRRKMSRSRTWWTFSAVLICLLSKSQSWGVTLGPETPVRTGYEPVVNCDHRGTSGRLLQVFVKVVSRSARDFLRVSDRALLWSSKFRICRDFFGQLPKEAAFSSKLGHY